MVSVSVELVNDTLVEESETFFAHLESTIGEIDNVDFDPISAAMTIVDDDCK